MKGSFVTVEIVAKKAGVSKSTVSRALRGHPAISASTTDKVKRAAEEAGYQANPVVSTVMRRMRGPGTAITLGTLAYLTFEKTADEWRKFSTFKYLFEGACARAHLAGFRIDEIWAHPKVVSGPRLMQILRTRNIHGVILSPTFG